MATTRERTWARDCGSEFSRRAKEGRRYGDYENVRIKKLCTRCQSCNRLDMSQTVNQLRNLVDYGVVNDNALQLKLGYILRVKNPDPSIASTIIVLDRCGCVTLHFILG